MAKVSPVEELKRKWKYFLEQEYQKEAHSGIKEYYKSHGVEASQKGITPHQEFMRDTRGLTYLDTSIESEAFLHHETRKLDNAGCFSFENVKCEASTSLANAKVEIAYDSMNTGTIKVMYQDMEPIKAHRVRIDSFRDTKTAIPVAMTEKMPETSRLLDVLEKKYKEEHQLMANAHSFGECGKTGDINV